MSRSCGCPPARVEGGRGPRPGLECQGSKARMLAVTAGQPVVFLRKRHRLPIAALTAAQQYLSEGGELGTQERLRARPPGDRRASEHPRPGPHPPYRAARRARYPTGPPASSSTSPRQHRSPGRGAGRLRDDPARFAELLSADRSGQDQLRGGVVPVRHGQVVDAAQGPADRRVGVELVDDDRLGSKP